MAKTYNLFISHSWAYTDAYDKLVNMLDNANHFSYRNYSVPKSDPIHNATTDEALMKAIQNKMSNCHAIIILAGVYSTYSKWINKEIILANKGFQRPKPIIAIQPWAAERTSQVVKENANRIVSWNTNSIIKAIQEVGLTPS